MHTLYRANVCIRRCDYSEHYAIFVWKFLSVSAKENIPVQSITASYICMYMNGAL